VSFVLAALFLALLLACLGLHVFGLPGNWAILVLVILWDLVHPQAHFGLALYAVLAGLALVGEGLEFLAQLVGAKRYGASLQGNVGGFVGALVGALLGAPFFLGFGALLGAVAGAFFGCYTFERFHGRAGAAALTAAKGALLGKVLGLAAKTACGVVMWVAAAREIWPA
jgi:uncharacterized protein YqgC (DUF456 family)